MAKLTQIHGKLAARLENAHGELAESRRLLRETMLTFTRPAARRAVPRWRTTIFHFLRQGGVDADLAARAANLEADCLNRRLLFVREHESMARLRRMARREAWGQILDNRMWFKEHMHGLKRRAERRGR